MKFSDFNIITENDEGNQVLFNSMSGSIFELDQRVTEIFKNNDLSLLSPEEIETLTLHQIIVKDESFQLETYNYGHNLQKYDSQMLSITWLTTWGCNLNCTYCFEGNLKNSKIMSETEDIDRMLKFVKNKYINNKFKVLAVTLFGGEPMMNYKGIQYGLSLFRAFCEENHIQLVINMVSNGLLLNKDNVQFLIDHGLSMIQITLDGPKELHDQKRIYSNGGGSYDRIIDRLEFLKKENNQLNIVIRINIDKENFEHAEILLKELELRGLNTFTIDFGIIRDEATSCGNISNICFPDESLGKILYSLWNSAIKHGFTVKTVPSKRYMYCGLNKENSYTFTPKMEFYKCWEHLGDQTHKFGDLNDRGEIVIDNHKYYEWMNKNPIEIQECKSCKYLGTCGGGCSVNSFNRHGTYQSPGCYQVKGVIEKQLIFAISNNQINERG